MASRQPTIEELIEKVKIRKEILDRECSDRDLRELTQFCDNWRLIGHYLGLEKYLNDINRDNTSEEEKRIALLRRWKQVFDFRATYRMLVGALMKCDNVQSARKLMEYLANQEKTTDGDMDAFLPQFQTFTMDEYLVKKNIDSFTLPQQKIIFTPIKKTDILDFPFSNDQPPRRPRSNVPAARNTRHFDEEEEEEKSDREEHIKCTVTLQELDERYTKLLEEFDDLLETIPVGKLCKSAKCLPTAVKSDLKNPKEALTCLSKAADVADFMVGLNIHGNYMKPSLLEYMIGRHGNERLKAMMSEYMFDLQHYQEATRLKEFVCVETGCVNPDDSEFTAKLGRNWEEKSLKDLRHAQKKEHRRDSVL